MSRNKKNDSQNQEPETKETKVQTSTFYIILQLLIEPLRN